MIMPPLKLFNQVSQLIGVVRGRVEAINCPVVGLSYKKMITCNNKTKNTKTALKFTWPATPFAYDNMASSFLKMNSNNNTE